jgi:hypothetical protein
MKARLPIMAIIRLQEHKVTKNKKAYNRKNKEWKKNA